MANAKPKSGKMIKPVAAIAPAVQPPATSPLRVTVFVNGILTFPGDAKDWNFRAVTWTHMNHPVLHARNFEYFCGPIGRAFGQHGRAKKLAALMREYEKGGHTVSLVGHSNGCDVILDALKLMDWPDIDELHLVSGACNANFRGNGLNEALKNKQVGQVFVYVAGKDRWLRLANTVMGHMLGFGTMGLHGALEIADDVKDRVHRIFKPEYDHSTWWENRYFSNTMAEFPGVK